MYNSMIAQPFTVADFSGGITDNYLTAPSNKYRRAENFFITDEKKLITRYGSEIVSTTNYLPGYTITNPRVGLTFQYEDVIFENVGRNLYYNNSGYAELVGPSSNPALAAGTSASRSSVAFWNKHVLLTNDASGLPMKVYKDSGGVFRVRNAGLPALGSTPSASGGITKILALANDIKSKYATHIASAPAHTAGVDATNTISASNATDLTSLITLVTEMLVDYNAHEKDGEKSAAWTYHLAEEDYDHSLDSVVAPTTMAECLERLEDIKAKFNGHINDVRVHGTPTTSVTLTDNGAHNYIYRFVHYYTYTIGSVAFEDFGPTTELEVSNVDKPDVTAVSITAIPTFTNGATGNYDTSNIKVKIYRTTDNGETFYYAGQVSLGTTTYSDTMSDATLEVSTLLYTDGGVLDNDPPPKAKYITVANNCAWYTHIEESSVVYPNRVRQSVQYDIDACPATFFVDLEDTITGVGSIGIYPIVFCTNRIYRLEGVYDLTGRGGIDAREISRTVGAVNHLSIVQTRDGIFFAGQDGFYFTNGYEVLKISREFNNTYKTLVSTATQKGNIYGMYEALLNRVWWAVQVDSGSADNDACYVADLNYGIKPDTPFTTISGGLSFAPTALLYYNNTVYRSDRRGYLFTHSNDFLTDPVVSTSAAPSAWTTQAIIYDYFSAGFDFGRGDVRKWVPKIILNARNVSNVSTAINSYNDDSENPAELKEARILSNIVWGDETLVWGDADLVWNEDEILAVMRRFPAGGLRCSYKQIQFTNSFTVITNSDTFGTGTVSSVSKTVTLNTAPTKEWPSAIVGYYISFETDDYVQNFEVTERTSDSVIKFSDALNDSTAGSTTKWVLRGYRKGDILNPLDYSIMFAYMSDTQSRYNASQVGNNA